ncbi:MAG: glycosyltransferase [Clostridia bacterium]|nr:glycosyltransferase [Clostridia bacterium]
MKKLSIIVPIYNVEKYLNQCIESILAQTMTDYEVILVDDGSLDNSGAICDEYAQKHDNVFAFHKENGGLSDARNYGVSKAQGQYIIFIDSDDYYGETTLFEKLASVIDERHPVAIGFSMKRVDSITGECIKYEYHYNEELLNNCSKMEVVLKHLIENDQFMISACGYAVRRDFVTDNELFFEKGLVGEDIERSFRLFSYDFPIVFVDLPAYIARRGREGSITSTIGEKNINDLLYIVEKYASKFSNSNNPQERLLLNYLAYQYSILCGLLIKTKDKQFKKNITTKVKELKWLLNYDLHPKVKRVRRLAKFLGISMTIKGLGFYLKHR